MSDAPGLRGVVVLESSISAIIDDSLTYRGIPVGELAGQASFEEVIFLLWFGRLPAVSELEGFKDDLRQASRAPESLASTADFSNSASPLQMMQAATLWLGSQERRPLDDVRQGCEILATMPAIIAHWASQGRSSPEPPTNGGIARQLLELLLDRPPLEWEWQALDCSLILVADHEMNASTFAARVAASTLTDVYQAILAALAALSGPLHGGALARAGEFLQSFDSPDHAARETIARLQTGERIAGFGHSVYGQGDPRAGLFRDIAAGLAGHTDRDSYLLIADRVSDAVRETSGQESNVDFYGAVCWLMLGLSPELFPALFALGRLAGWIAHILEQHENNRLIRPRARYVGALDRRYVPADKRES